MSILFINISPNPNGDTARPAVLLQGKEYEKLNLIATGKVNFNTVAYMRAKKQRWAL